MTSTAALPTARTATTNSVNGTSKITKSTSSSARPPSTASSANDDYEYNALITSLPTTHTAPLWEQMAALNPRLPAPKTIPHIWRYADVRPQLLKAGQVVPEEKAERRVLMFVNPGSDGRGTPPYTTDTLYAGLQLVNPDEVAPAHRHVAVATRFVIEAPETAPSMSSTSSTSSPPASPDAYQHSSEPEHDEPPRMAFTAIQARRIPMRRHDLIVTPRWTWHDHGNCGKSPVIWLDGLDLPNFQHVPVHFVEHYADSRYPASDVNRGECSWVVPWERMKSVLDQAARGGKTYVEQRYQKPHGGEISSILGAMAARLAAGCTSSPKRETSSAVWHVVQGSGWTEVDGARMTWTAGDTFAVPAWAEWSHGAEEGEVSGQGGEDGTVYLYRFDDTPMLQALGWYRTDQDDVEALADE